MTGGKHLPYDVKARAMEMFPGEAVTEYYGLTETGVNAIATAADLRTFPGSSGRVLDGSDILVLDEHGRRLPDGATGRIAIHSYQLFDRYLNGPAAPFMLLNGKRYFVSADIGHVEAGSVFLTNRAFCEDFSHTNLFLLEDRVRQIPCVSDAAAIVRRPGVLNLFVSIKNDNAAVARRLAVVLKELGGDAKFEVAFVERIPYGATGKVQIDELFSRST